MAADAVERPSPWSIFRLGRACRLDDRQCIPSSGAPVKKEIVIMAFRPLIFGVLFIAVFVMIILSIIWVDKSHPIRQPDPLAPSTTPSSPPPSAQ